MKELNKRADDNHFLVNSIKLLLQTAMVKLTANVKLVLRKKIALLAGANEFNNIGGNTEWFNFATRLPAVLD